MKTVALIVAGGRGIRFGADIPKQFRNLLDRPLLSWTIMQFERAEKVDEIVVVVPEDFLLYANERVVNPYPFQKVTKIVVGGENRTESVSIGLKSIPYSTGYVAIHDGARPLVYHGDVDRVIEVAQRDRAAILARPISDTVKRVEGEFIISTLDRARLFLAETPQVFQYDLINTAHNNPSGPKTAIDDAYLVEILGFKVKVVIPEKPNLKVTTEDDLAMARYFLEEEYEAGN